MEIPQSCCPMKFISQYRHETKLETLFNTVIVMIKAAAPHVFHHLVQSFPSILHQASIRWLKTDFP